MIHTYFMAVDTKFKPFTPDIVTCNTLTPDQASSLSLILCLGSCFQTAKKNWTSLRTIVSILRPLDLSMLLSIADCGHFVTYSWRNPRQFYTSRLSLVVVERCTTFLHGYRACSSRMQRCSVDMCGHGLRDAANTAAVSSLTEHDQQCDKALLQEGKNGS